MGWSCRTDALNTFNRIQKALCLGPTQNVYCYGGQDYLIETDGIEYDDGCIKGQVFRLNGNMVMPFMEFHIGPDGDFLAGPAVWQFVLEGKTPKELTKPKR